MNRHVSTLSRASDFHLLRAVNTVHLRERERERERDKRKKEKEGKSELYVACKSTQMYSIRTDLHSDAGAVKRLMGPRNVVYSSHCEPVSYVVSFLRSVLFNVLAQMAMRKTLDGFQGGLQIGRRLIANLRYADDIILMATSEAELQEAAVFAADSV